MLDLVKSIENFDEISDSKLKDLIYDMLWKLHFNMYLKGVIYLTDAIMLAYKDNSLLYDTNELMSKTAKLHDLDEKNIRNNIDNALNLAFKFDNVNFDIDFFDGYYDGRKISLKYFISLSVHYLEQIEKNNLLTEIK